MMGDELEGMGTGRPALEKYPVPFSGQLVGSTVGQRLCLQRDARQSGCAPGPGSTRRRQSLGHEQSANPILHGDTPADQVLSRRNQRPPLPHRRRRQRHRRQLPQCVELRQPQGVVLIGLAFEVLELPGLAGRVRHQAAHATFAAQIVNPAGQKSGLDDDDAWLFLGE